MQGFYNIIKPTGASSAFIVGKVKKAVKQKRVGHLGTLDPAASGVLTIAVGKATKFFDYFLNKDKVYFAIAEFGIQTDTLDSEGAIIETNNKKIDKKDIEENLIKFIGKIDQVPPMYSAISINGQRAYEIARNGGVVEMPMRTIDIYSFDFVRQIDDNKFAFRIHCSAGTYIRTLLSDLAKSLGTIANIPVIIREKSGNFELFNASTIEEIQNEPQKHLIKVEDVFSNLKKVNFDEKDLKKVINGVKIQNSYKIDENQEFLGYVNNQLFGLFACENNELLCKINLYEGD